MSEAVLGNPTVQAKLPRPTPPVNVTEPRQHFIDTVRSIVDFGISATSGISTSISDQSPVWTAGEPSPGTAFPDEVEFLGWGDWVKCNTFSQETPKQFDCTYRPSDQSMASQDLLPFWSLAECKTTAKNQPTTVFVAHNYARTCKPAHGAWLDALSSPWQQLGDVVRQGLMGYSPTLNLDPIETYREDRQAASQSRKEALEDLRRRLDVATADYAQRSPREVVLRLTEDLGAGQLLTSRALEVSPTAVRKWRRGEQARPEHRSRLSQFAAFCVMLTELGLHDPAGWVDIPLSTETTLTPLEFFLHGKTELVLLQVSGLATPHETLDAFDPKWRSHFPLDPDYEVVTLADGTRSAVPRR